MLSKTQVLVLGSGWLATVVLAWLTGSYFSSGPKQLTYGIMSMDASSQQALMPISQASRPKDMDICDKNYQTKEAVHKEMVEVRKYWIGYNGGTVEGWDAKMPLTSVDATKGHTLWDTYAPTYGCDVPSQLGGIGPREGEDYWACNIHRLQEEESCLVYSFGVGFDTTFELDLLHHAPDCVVRVHDPTVSQERFWSFVKRDTMKWMKPLKPGALNFYKIGIGQVTEKANFAKNDSSFYRSPQDAWVMTLLDIMKKHGDQGKRIHLFKIDVEGAELPGFRKANEDGLIPLMDQILLEVHPDGCDPRKKQWHSTTRVQINWLFEMLEGHGLRCFAGTPNFVSLPRKGVTYPTCAQLSFVRRGTRYAMPGVCEPLS